jgi:hypothetical protein
MTAQEDDARMVIVRVAARNRDDMVVSVLERWSAATFVAAMPCVERSA